MRRAHTLYASTDASSLANAQSTAAFKVVLNTSTGAYTYTQLKPIDHPLHDNQGTGGTPETAYEDNITIALQYQVKDSNSDSATGTLNVTINDDVPQVKAIEKTVTEGSSDTNIMLILDRSGSMDFAPVSPAMPRGSTCSRPRPRSCSTSMTQPATSRSRSSSSTTTPRSRAAYWLSSAQAKTYIDGLTADDGTDYDDATALAPDAFDDPGKLTTPGVRNVAYFISDGQPDPTSEQVSGSRADRLDQLRQRERHRLLMPSASVRRRRTPTSIRSPMTVAVRLGTDTDALIVTDLNQLQATLVGTVNPSISGSVIDGSIPTSFGADGGYVKSIAIGGKTYTYSPATDNDLHGLGSERTRLSTPRPTS